MSAIELTGAAGMSPQRQEWKLIELLRRGDDEAWEKFIERHQDMIYSLALNILGDVSDAEDVAQDVFLSAYRSIGKFQGKSMLSTWLYAIARNLCLNRLRKKRTIREEKLDEDVDSLPEHLPENRDAMTPEQIVIGREWQEEIRHCVSRLPLIYREAIALIFFQGLKYEEAAKLTNRSVGTLKSQVWRGLRILTKDKGLCKWQGVN